jgi:hypothetical protein
VKKDMTDARVKGLLQKINFIEADMQLHKQILFSIPGEDKKEIQRVLGLLARQKEQIRQLRQEIKKTDEQAYNNLIAIEQGVLKFQQMAQGKDFTEVRTLNETGECFITLADGTRLDCLVTARGADGNWTVLTLEGETREFPAGLIR